MFFFLRVVSAYGLIHVGYFSTGFIFLNVNKGVKIRFIPCFEMGGLQGE